jgi:hypothetical protein
LDGSSVALELLLELEEGGVLVAPPAALPEGEVLVAPLAVPLAEPEPLTEPLVVPPPAESFFAVSVEEEDELEDDGELGVVVPDAEPEAEPEGELGVVAEPDDEVAPEPGAAPRLPALSPQAVSTPAPSAMEIATARAESLI